MQIVALESRHLAMVHEVYRRATRPVPHCRFAPSRHHLAAGLRRPLPEHTEIVVAEEGGLVRGLAALLDGGSRVEGAREAELTALFTEDAPAGQLLLDAVTSRALVRGVQRLVAFPPEHFHCPIASYNAGWGGLSDRQALVAHLLARNGFTPFHRELHLEWTGDRSPPVPAYEAPGITVGTRATARGGAALVAFAAGEEIGVCDYSPLDGLSDDPAARHWGYIWGLYVHEGMRRRGIGRLLMSRVLAQLSAQGCRGCWLTTTATNWPAQALYLALGCEVVDASTCFHKELRPGTSVAS